MFWDEYHFATIFIAVIFSFVMGFGFGTSAGNKYAGATAVNGDAVVIESCDQEPAEFFCECTCP
jgi:hypothetical protein